MRGSVQKVSMGLAVCAVWGKRMGKTDVNLERRAYQGQVSSLVGVMALNVVSSPNCN